MKKRIIFLVIVILVVAFIVGILLVDRSKNHNLLTDPADYYLNNGDTWGNYDKDAIPNEECAIAVATAIFQNMENGKYSSNRTLSFVMFDEDDQVWFVTFAKDTPVPTAGDCWTIALQKQDGKVLRIWFGE